MNNSNKKLAEINKQIKELSLAERLQLYISETDCLDLIRNDGYNLSEYSLVDDVMFDVELRDFERAMLKATGNWDPTPNE